MATAYNADTLADQQLDLTWSVAGTFKRPFSFNIGTNTAGAGFIINDTVYLAPIPYKSGGGGTGAGVYLMNFHIDLPTLDTGTSVRMSIGDNNGAAGAFQAIWYATATFGANNFTTIEGSAAVSATTVTGRAATSGAPAAQLPKLYSVSKLYSGYAAWPTVYFMMKITTAPNTAVTTGTITGWLELQTANSTNGSF